MVGNENVNSLQNRIVETVAKHLSPAALRYGYSDVPLETTIKWRPLVLFLGNYSSGKSTLINELLGGDIQTTGQAPTDDSFTVITYGDGDKPDGKEGVVVTEERDGKHVLNNTDLPFEILKKYGQRFSSHLCMKKVNSPFLKDIAVIDTPGMHDSISQRDRGYDYQQVIGDLSQIADLTFVLFDPHKAGTIREAHTSLKETLPKSTFEDRIMFVLNRIDECASLPDLLKVYGTLCWNLSQITGRKDIPAIHLTYSSGAAYASSAIANRDMSYIKLLDNQRTELTKTIGKVPARRLDNMAAFVETHSENLSHLLEAIIAYRRKLRAYKFKTGAMGFFASVLLGCVAALATAMSDTFADSGLYLHCLAGGGVAAATLSLWTAFAANRLSSSYHGKLLKNIDELTPLASQSRKDSWQSVRSLVLKYIEKTTGVFSLKKVKQEYSEVNGVFKKGARELRESVNKTRTVGNQGK